MSLPKTLIVVLVASLSLAACGNASVESTAPAQAETAAPVPAMTNASSAMPVVERINPVLTVEAIEPSVPFWEALGFELTNPSYTDGRLIFTEFVKNGLTIHYQTLQQVANNTPATAEALRGSSAMVYVTVDQLDGIVERLGDAEVVIPRRRTAWGADEIYVKEPGGHIIGFAAFGN